MKKSRSIRKLAVCIVFSACFLSLNIYGQPAGTLDSTFGNNGVVYCETNFTCIPSIIDAQNRVVSWGKFNDSTLALHRYLIDGTADASFGNNGQLLLHTDSASISLLQFQTDEKIILAGTIPHWPNTNFNYEDFYISRFLPGGSLDSLFGNQGRMILDLGQTERVSGISMHMDSLLLISGSSGWSIWTISNYDVVLLRLRPDGALDSSFATNGVSITDVTEEGYGSTGSSDLLVRTDEKIIVSAHSSSFILLRYNADGSLDSSFGNNGISIDSFTSLFGFDIAVEDDNSILVAGEENCFDCPSSLRLSKYKPDGLIDSSFAVFGNYQSSVNFNNKGFYALQIQGDHKIITAGFLHDSLVLMRFTPEGSPDSTFGVQGMVRNQFDGLSCTGNLICLFPNDKITVVGYATDQSYFSKVFVARYNNDIMNGMLYETDEDENGAIVYPNPVTDFVTIALAGDSKKADVIVTSSNGKIIYKTSVTQKQKLVVDTRSFSAGVYFIQIRSGKFTETKKIIIQN